MSDVFRKIKEVPEKEAAELFGNKILPMYVVFLFYSILWTTEAEVCPRFPPVFHEWFVETFPEPSAWLSSRLMYGRTAAVMSMVGFILG